jgi:hypothetical protein
MSQNVGWLVWASKQPYRLELRVPSARSASRPCPLGGFASRDKGTNRRFDGSSYPQKQQHKASQNPPRQL